MSHSMTLKEAEQFTGLSVSTLRAYIRAGRLPAARRGQRLLVVSRADLAALDTPL